MSPGTRSAFLAKEKGKDFRLLFETIWQDRAKNAGWNLVISYEGEACLFRLTRSPAF